MADCITQTDLIQDAEDLVPMPTEATYCKPLSGSFKLCRFTWRTLYAPCLDWGLMNYTQFFYTIHLLLGNSRLSFEMLIYNSMLCIRVCYLMRFSTPYIYPVLEDVPSLTSTVLQVLKSFLLSCVGASSSIIISHRGLFFFKERDAMH